MKKYTLLLLLLLFLFIGKRPVTAVYNPEGVQNNRFGIHILEPEDLTDAQKLVNSSGGLWGYVTFVIRDDQRNLEQWSSYFRALREKNLIPIIRIATHIENGSWKKPSKDDVSAWVSFLDSLPWPTKNRYIILFNEPNHADEWGGTIDPSDYADVAHEFLVNLRMKSVDFFVLNAGFDMAASNITNKTADALWYMEQMEEKVPGIFQMFDGWNSHSYPNPGFSQSPLKTGRASIASYRFEQEFLKNHFQVSPKPVFVTETGWVSGSNGLNEQTVASYFKTAFETVWTDSNLIAVTPFLLNYPETLFSSFSWKKQDGSFKPQYEEVLGISKNEGQPELTPVSLFGKLALKMQDWEAPPKLNLIPEPLL